MKKLEPIKQNKKFYAVPNTYDTRTDLYNTDERYERNGDRDYIATFMHAQHQNLEFEHYKTGILVSYVDNLDARGMKVTKDNQVFEFYNNEGKKVWENNSYVYNDGQKSKKMKFYVTENGIYDNTEENNKKRFTFTKYDGLDLSSSSYEHLHKTLKEHSQIEDLSRF